MFMSFSDIALEQRRPFEYKLAMACEVVEQAFSLSTHNRAVAFSGGKDSTVLWHLIRRVFPRADVYCVFGNTGVEYPESLRFARALGRDWGGEFFRETRLGRTDVEGLKYVAQREVLEWLVECGRVGDVLRVDGRLKSTAALERAATPGMWDDFRRRKLVWSRGSLMSYWWCADQFGFPIMGKAASMLDARRINVDCFLRFSESSSVRRELLDYYEILRVCRFSQHCCKCLKKDPAEKLQAELDVDLVFKGLMASESRSRRTNFSTRGYIFRSSRPHLGGDPFFHCNPLSVWTDADIWSYIEKFNVPYSPLYDIEYCDYAAGRSCRIARNGCYGCATDILFKNNHMSILRQTHRDLWRVVMRYGMADELRSLARCGVNGPLFDAGYLDPEAVIEYRQCAFDDMGDIFDSGDLLFEYDPELV
jgi:3'-phosphoadenosine 5'-phosphosulfate sulfotransferase (PAPS reductase)/FAD synthetase